MDLNEFLERGRPRWLRLAELLDHIERQGLRSLSLHQAQEFGRLYRAASSDLLWARSRAASADLMDSLNDLVARAYAQTYPGEKPRLREVTRFFARGFPQLVRNEWKALVLAYALFFLGAVLGFAATKTDPQAMLFLVPEEHLNLDPAERVTNEAEKPLADAQSQSSFSSFLFTHNIQVAFLAFALGLTLGIGTGILLTTNGILLGALAAVYHSKGHALWFWAWILPHGVLEISSICLAGAAGLILGRALIMPGSYSRIAALRKESRIAIRLCLGTIPIFVIAGIIEGTISQIHQPHLSSWFKISFALATGVLLTIYLVLLGREREKPSF